MKTKGEYQHEPLILPENWEGDAERFGVRLKRLIDELYRKTGELERRVKELEKNDPVQRE